MAADKQDDGLLWEYMSTFYGYGDYGAGYWFVDMEEGGGNSAAEVERRLLPPGWGGRQVRSWRGAAAVADGRRSRRGASAGEPFAQSRAFSSLRVQEMHR